MHTMTLQINDEDALKTLLELERRHYISILENSNTNSPSLPGSPMSQSEFEKLIAEAEQSPLITLNEAKEKWARQKERFQQSIR